MQTVFAYLRMLSAEAGQIASNLDQNDWIVIGFAAFVIGFVVLRSSGLKVA